MLACFIKKQKKTTKKKQEKQESIISVQAHKLLWTL